MSPRGKLTIGRIVIFLHFLSNFSLDSTSGSFDAPTWVEKIEVYGLKKVPALLEVSSNGKSLISCRRDKNYFRPIVETAGLEAGG